MKSYRKHLGKAFKDEVLKVNATSGHFKSAKVKGGPWEDYLIPNYRESELPVSLSPWRAVGMGICILIIFFGLFLRLFHLQVVQGRENRVRADYNRVRARIIHAPRGVIFDRNGKILAENTPGFRLEERIISRDEALALEAKSDSAFESLEVDSIRFYPYGEVTSHVLGYVGQISTEELKISQFADYKLGDRVGRTGIEQVYESELKGQDGAEIIEIDASGKKLGTLRRVDPKPGKNLYLALDIDLQKVVFTSLQKGTEKVGSCCGAVVAENPRTGEILSLVSLPSYNSNAFTDPRESGKAVRYFEEENSPLLNRAISGTYPPGSTFKITTALAGLSSGKINRSTQIEDTGVMSLGIWSFANWYFTQYGGKDGLVDVVKALRRSNDIFFYRVGEMTGVGVLGKTAKKLGFGDRLGIDLPGEAEGLVPDGEWKQKNIGDVWYPGDTLHMAIGQGYLLTTPLQVLAQTSFVASEGRLIQPRLVGKVTTPNGTLIRQLAPEAGIEDLVKKEDLELVKLGLSQVNQPGGTAWPFFRFSVPVSGKTGTAEFGDPQGKTHAWYTSYAPTDDPRIALTVLIEAGGEGSNVAAPIAKEIYTWYFNPDKTNLRSLDTLPQATDSGKQLGE